MTNSEIKNRLAHTVALLSVPGLGRTLLSRLIAKFGSAEAACSASLADLESIPRLSRTVAQAVVQNDHYEEARQTAARVIQMGWQVLFPDSEHYPTLLRNVVDRPELLFATGDQGPADQQLIAIVGTRHATEAGRRFAQKLAKSLSEAGITVVSGMAEGIDGAAHRGALEAGGRTAAVWGTPLDVVYPPSHRALAKEIEAHGTIYSEYLPGSGISAANFPQRNRIISGLAEAVVVVEAGEKSGALITAGCALDQGRELFAVPGPPEANHALGANALIKHGAALLTSIDDIFAALPRLKGEVRAKKFRQLPDLTESEQQMVSLLSAGPIQIDQLCRQTNWPVSDLMEFLLALELKGVVQELSGKRFILAE